MNRDTQRKGDIGVTQAIATFTRKGYDVALPVTESAAYDLIVDDGELHRVQVKYSSGRDVDLRCIHSNSQGYVVKLYNNSFDWLYVLKADGSEYLIDQDLSGRRSITPKEEHRI
jgi:hypothetical protein